MNIKNTVLTRRIMDDVFEKINGGSSVHQGVEFEYSWSSLAEKISIEGAYTYGDYRFDEFVDAGNDYSGNRLPGTALHKLYNRLTIAPLKRWEMNLDYHLVTDVLLNDANTVSGKGYQLFNAGLSYILSSGEKWKASLSASVHNLFDIHYSPMFQINAPGTRPRYYYPGKPRSFYFNVRFTHRI
jgi:iron complex outermembrane receptor protein